MRAKAAGVRLAAALALLGVGGLALAAPAQAHPLGNFTVSHYDGLTLHPDRLDLLSVVDSAEIPTRQAFPTIDLDDDGTLSPAELDRAAAQQCDEVLAATRATVDDAVVGLTLSSAALSVRPGAASLPTLRLECRSSAEAALDGPATVTFTQDHRTDRIGWREITATGEGVVIEDPPVPVLSVSDELRSYPDDLLSTPLDVRSVQLSTRPGAAGAVGAASQDLPAGAGPFTRLVASGDRLLESYVGAQRLTPLVGTVAVLLAALLGAGHALLPGHGKTVMAAYLAGRRGRRRDAVLVGATVTVTHTVGVLALGLVLTLASGLAGESVLRYLGVLSGLLVVVVGLVLLRDAVRERRDHDPGPDGRPAERETVPAAPAVVGAPGASGAVGAAGAAAVGHVHAAVPEAAPGTTPHDDHGHAGSAHGGHSHGGAGHSHGGHAHGGAGHTHGGHTHGGAGHTHGPGGHTHQPGFSRRSLVGIGVAGGLVPSPSALVVLLGAIALGRTVFGVLLVLAYGLGMAGVLTAVGLLLVHGRARLDRMAGRGRTSARTARVLALLPLLTAVLVVAVGAGLAVRGLLA